MFNALPDPLAVASLQVSLLDAQGLRTLDAPLQQPLAPAAQAWPAGWHAALQPGRWHHVYLRVPLRCPGRLELQDVTLRLSGGGGLQWEVRE